jgi:hypothetical protein
MDPPLLRMAPKRQNGCGIEPTIHHGEASPLAQTISALGIDIATLVLHVVGMDDAAYLVCRKCFARI